MKRVVLGLVGLVALVFVILTIGALRVPAPAPAAAAGPAVTVDSARAAERLGKAVRRRVRNPP